jgi:MscS family membrane protein
MVMDMTTLPPATTFCLEDRLWFLEMIIGVVVLVALNFLFKRIVKHMRHRALSTASCWQEKLDHILYIPFQILMWILGSTLVFEILGRRFDFSFFEEYIDAFRSTGFVVCLAWALLRWKAVLQREWFNKEGRVRQIDRGFTQVMGKIISIIIIVIAAMVVLGVWGLNIGPLIAFGGIGAAAVGFSAKDVLANFFGGLMLYINRPFMIGDCILLPEQNLEGYVEEIGWNLTTVRDKDKRPVYLPNSTFSNALVINAARMTHRRIRETISISYEDFPKIASLVEALRSMISSHPDMDTHLPFLVVLNGFGESGLNLFIDVYTLQTRYDQFLRVKHEILMLIYQEMLKAKVSFSSPNMVITGQIKTSTS